MAHLLRNVHIHHVTPIDCWVWGKWGYYGIWGIGYEVWGMGCGVPRSPGPPVSTLHQFQFQINSHLHIYIKSNPIPIDRTSFSTTQPGSGSNPIQHQIKSTSRMQSKNQTNPTTFHIVFPTFVRHLSLRAGHPSPFHSIHPHSFQISSSFCFVFSLFMVRRRRRKLYKFPNKIRGCNKRSYHSHWDT